MGTPHDAHAPSSLPAYGLPARTCLTSSWLNPLRVLSLLKSRGDPLQDLYRFPLMPSEVDINMLTPSRQQMQKSQFLRPKVKK